MTGHLPDAAPRYVLAFDLGASSGRAMIGTLRGERLEMEEIHRFPNDPVHAGAHMYWDILRLLHEMKQGILQAHHYVARCAKEDGVQANVASIGIDSWAVDFGLLDAQDELLGNPYHYRDHQTSGMMEELFSVIPREEMFARTGIQFMPINTLYHLVAMQKRNATALREAKTFLMIPDLLRFFLTGEKKNEFTNATTTQMFHPLNKSWDTALLDRLEIPSHLFSEPVQPGTVVGTLSAAVCAELGVDTIPVIAVGEHDTASAVVAVPAKEAQFAYLISGTWSLLGTEVREPVLSPEALKWNFTNEGGVDHTYRLLKNIMGLWLLQECRRAWGKEGMSYTFAELAEMASQATPFQTLIDPDDPLFLNPVNMPEAIRGYCERTGQVVPDHIGAYVRCIIESLALKYRYVLEHTERLVGVVYEGLHMVGGGIHNALLCQFTANAIGRPVWAGPAEASAIGNIVVQMIALNEVEDIASARRLIRNSFPMVEYKPEDKAAWENVYERFVQLVEKEQET